MPSTGQMLDSLNQLSLLQKIDTTRNWRMQAALDRKLRRSPARSTRRRKQNTPTPTIVGPTDSVGVSWTHRPALSILVIGVRFEARCVFPLREDQPSKTPEETTVLRHAKFSPRHFGARQPRICVSPAMYYYADYDEYDDHYNDDAAGYDPPEASYDTYEPHYELEPDIDYPAYEGMVDGDEYKSEVVEQASWDEPRCMPRELEDTSFDVLALDESYAAWQETWATGPAMDSWREQIEASHDADASEDLVYTSLPDNRLVVGDDLWTSPEREQLQEVFERGGISDEEYVRVLGELWDEQLELKQLDERLCADGYVWDEKCDDYVHPVYGYASLEPDSEGVALSLTPPDHVFLMHSVPPPPPPVLPVPVRTSRPSYRLARGPRLGPLKPPSAILLLRTPQPQTQHPFRRRQRRLLAASARTHPHRVLARDSPPYVSTAASRARARSDPGPRPGKLKPPDARMIIATVPMPIPSVASMLQTATQLQARASLNPSPFVRDFPASGPNLFHCQCPTISALFLLGTHLRARSAPPQCLAPPFQKGHDSESARGRAAWFGGGGGGPFDILLSHHDAKLALPTDSPHKVIKSKEGEIQLPADRYNKPRESPQKRKMFRPNQHTPDDAFGDAGGSGTLDTSTGEIFNLGGSAASEGGEGSEEEIDAGKPYWWTDVHPLKARYLPARNLSPTPGTPDSDADLVPLSDRPGLVDMSIDNDEESI
ncbi:hypothetical protein B0H14DRAFT_2560631 [Mycena olivaceomarginata]|nr:hypothetical protein B0H14DRAFT_2560631 [Mycena olivaceomarginata]